MCGICGIYGPEAEPDAVDAMLALMEQRGPDGYGTYVSPGVVLGHRRLAIVDLSDRGRQPMISHDGMVAIAVNGEIYNYRALRQELEAIGHVFTSDCDSETVIHAWRAWGVDSFTRFNGMFAIALYDRRHHALYLVRDRMGIKPIFFWRKQETVIFASDIRAIVAASGRKEWPLSATGLQQYLAHQNRFEDETMLEGIQMVRPGEIRRIDASGIESHFFADPLTTQERLESSFEKTVNDFRSVLADAVDRHLMSDVPLASYLSAGIDSGMVTLSAGARLKGNGPVAFTGTFDKGGWYDEATGAALTAASMKLNHQLVHINADSFKHYFDDLIYALEEPRMGTGALPQFLLAKKVAETHKVVLTGHGGDELFSGYPVFKFLAIREAFFRNRRGIWPLLCALRPSELPHIAYFVYSSISRRSQKPFLPVLFEKKRLSKLLRRDVSAAVFESEGDARDKGTVKMDFDGLMRQYIKDYLPGLLVVEDKISMAHSLESRTPLLDNELVAFALSVPASLKLNDNELKAIPKAAARGVLPDQIFTMPKRGFPNPLASWLRGPLSMWMQSRLCDPQGSLSTIFDPSALNGLVKSYLRSWRRQFRPLDEIATHRIFMLLSLESFMRQYRERLGVTLTPPSAGKQS